MRALPVMTVIALLATGCVSWGPSEPSLGGWPLGEPTECRSIVLAAAAGDAGLSDPSAHLACYFEGTYLHDGQPYIVTRSGGVTIIVVTTGDGARRAIGVHCGVGCNLAAPPAAP